jgi:hypothetical protein
MEPQEGASDIDPHIWVVFFDEDGDPYYFHPATSDTTRDKPTQAEIRLLSEAEWEAIFEATQQDDTEAAGNDQAGAPDDTQPSVPHDNADGIGVIELEEAVDRPGSPTPSKPTSAGSYDWRSVVDDAGEK